MTKQYVATIQTNGRGFYEITQLINDYVLKASYKEGLCNIFLKHTSASLILCENADKDVRKDLENFFSELILDDSQLYHHSAEGKDDMPAHIRSVLTKNDLSIPIRNDRLGLGTWQGIFLWEHRLHNFERQLIITLLGNPF